MDLRETVIQCTVICSSVLSLSPAPLRTVLLLLPYAFNKRKYCWLWAEIWGKAAAR